MERAKAYDELLVFLSEHAGLPDLSALASESPRLRRILVRLALYGESAVIHALAAYLNLPPLAGPAERQLALGAIVQAMRNSLIARAEGAVMTSVAAVLQPALASRP